MTDTLRERLVALRFNDLTAVAKALKGGPLGFDPNRKFTRPMKESFADWIIAEFDAARIRGVLDEGVQALRDQQAADGQTVAESDHGTAPAATTAKPTGNDQAATVASAIAAALGGMKFGLSDAEVRALAHEVATGIATDTLASASSVAEAAAAKAIAEATIPRPIVVVRKDAAGEHRTDMGHQHRDFERLLKMCSVRTADGHSLNVWLVGPAGSGKTTAARNVAKALDLKFYFNGAIDTEYKLLGFTAANGQIVSRPFREAWTNGGVYLFDEVDASMPGAVLALNAALANGTCDFPDANVPRHPDCIIIAAANTFGTGANTDYVGRMKQDGAFLDRFVQLVWGIDEALETALSGNAKWAGRVQRYRAAVTKLGIKHIVSPRATYNGAALLAAGFAESDVVEMTVRKGLSDDQWAQVRAEAR